MAYSPSTFYIKNRFPMKLTPDTKRARAEAKQKFLEKQARERAELTARMDAEEAIMDKEKEGLIRRPHPLPPDRVDLRNRVHSRRYCRRLRKERLAQAQERVRHMRMSSTPSTPSTPTFPAESPDSSREPSNASSPPHTPRFSLRRASIMSIAFVLNEPQVPAHDEFTGGANTIQ
ncbi:hypothetical protein MMC07_008008 [Pseudocyphellaria aurata]|nr:hypothetical protein [Pseudocyphellaria aurata]